MSLKRELSKIADGGRVVIPIEFRRALGMDVGDDIILILAQGEIHLIPRKEAVRRAQALVAAAIPGDVSLAQELIKDRRKEAADE